MLPFQVGLTGAIASGKTTVANQLAQRGAVIIDADILARQAVAPGSPGLAAIATEFGSEFVKSDGSLDRATLGQLIFNDSAAREKLNGIVHPEVTRLRKEELAKLPGSALVVHVIPLLVETGLQGDFDYLVVVDIDPKVQLARLMQRNGLTEAEALARINSQASRAQRLAIADYVVDNSGSEQGLLDQLTALWQALLAAQQEYLAS